MKAKEPTEIDSPLDFSMQWGAGDTDAHVVLAAVEEWRALYGRRPTMGPKDRSVLRRGLRDVVMSAADKIPLTLAGPPVTASVSWDDVRAYLRAEEWDSFEDGETWVRPSDQVRLWLDDRPDDIGATVTTLARLASVSPGEMLVRIAGQTEPSYPGAMPWRARAQTSSECAALVHRGATDAQAADFLAEHVELLRAEYQRSRELIAAPMRLINSDTRRAAEDMRERCAAYVATSDPEDPREDVATAIRALSVDAKEGGEV